MMPPVQSTTIEGLSVVLYPGMCHISKGFYFATLEYAWEHLRLADSHGKGYSLTVHTLTLIKQWAKAHGYIKERRRAKTIDDKPAYRIFGRADNSQGFSEVGTITEEQWRKLDRQLTLPLALPTAKARRRAGAGGGR